MIRIVPYRRGGWEIDIRVKGPNGERIRERIKSPVPSRSGSLRWAQDRERVLLTRAAGAEDRPPAPKLESFATRFLEEYAEANRQKPSGIASKRTILRQHLIPELGTRRLDAIGNGDIQRLKAHLAGLNAKTVNNVLSVLKTLLRVAVEWQVIETEPCQVRLLRTSHSTEARFHDFEEYQRLIVAAGQVDRRAALIVLLGGEAGLRCGEMLALEWTDVDFGRQRLWVRRSDWEGHVGLPKGGRPRLIPMTTRLAEALKAHRHLRGVRILAQEHGEPLTRRIVQNLVQRAARLANLADGGVHILRHTFCSHLAMRGAPARAIQELAGHKDLSTTQRYMHLSPAAIETAIRVLEDPQVRGDLGETSENAKRK